MAKEWPRSLKWNSPVPTTPSNARPARGVATLADSPEVLNVRMANVAWVPDCRDETRETPDGVLQIVYETPRFVDDILRFVDEMIEFADGMEPIVNEMPNTRDETLHFVEDDR